MHYILSNIYSEENLVEVIMASEEIVKMMEKIDEIAIFSCKGAFIYEIEDGERQGEMTERSLFSEFIANSYKEAVDNAIKWIKDRYENVFKDHYKNSSIGSLKVSVHCIRRCDKHGRSQSSSTPAFFEWKCDFPYDLEHAKTKFAESDVGVFFHPMKEI